MSCRDVIEHVESIAAGELEPDMRLREHLESCPSCASALATARRIETLLAARPAPEAPARFTTTVQRSIRTERWRAEQQVDRIFNVAIAVAALLVIAAGAFMVNAGSVLETFGNVYALATEIGTDAARVAVPSLGTYVAATGLLVSGLVMWWWAES